MIRGKEGGFAGPVADRNTADEHQGTAHAARPSDAQRRYLVRGLAEAGGKLPLFDEDGRAVPRKTVESCLAHGWAEPCMVHPVRPDWQVCRLTEAGYAILLEGYGAARADPSRR